MSASQSTSSPQDDQLMASRVNFSDLSNTVQEKIIDLRQLDAKLDRKRSKKTLWEDQFAAQCRARNLPPFVRELRFAKQMKRQWKFDFAWDLPRTADHRPIRLAVEIEGLIMQKAIVNGVPQMVVLGGHASPIGIKKDMVKYATATLLGWHLLRFEQTMIASGFAVNMTMRVLHRMGYRIQS